jgi:hypothetical protein
VTYQWALDGPDAPFPTAQLTADDIPPPLISSRDHDAIQTVNQFAHTFNGYEWAGSLEELGDRTQRVHRAWAAGGGLPDDVDALRGCLFFWFRADRHAGGYGPYEADLVWLSALLDALRSTLRFPR